MFWLPAGLNLITRRSPGRQPLFFKFVHFRLTNDKNQPNTGSHFPWKAQVLLLLALIMDVLNIVLNMAKQDAYVKMPWQCPKKCFI